jgi:hypothetical protein
MMNVNESIYITKVENGFFVYPRGIFSEDDLSSGRVFQDFFAMVKFLNGHFPNDRQAELAMEEAERAG